MITDVADSSAKGCAAGDDKRIKLEGKTKEACGAATLMNKDCKTGIFMFVTNGDNGDECSCCTTSDAYEDNEKSQLFEAKPKFEMQDGECEPIDGFP